MSEILEPFSPGNFSNYEESFTFHFGRQYRRHTSFVKVQGGDLENIISLFGEPKKVLVDPLYLNPYIPIAWSISFDVPMIDEDGGEDQDIVNINLYLTTGIDGEQQWQLECTSYDEGEHFEKLLVSKRTKAKFDA